MKTAPVVVVAVMAFAASARSQVTDGVDSRERAPVPVAATGTARILGGLADGTPPPPAPAKPAFVVPAKDVISTKTIQHGGRTITIQRIQPIPLPPPPPAPAPETLEQAASLEQDAEVSEPPPKWDLLMVGATVFRFKDSPGLARSANVTPCSGRTISPAAPGLTSATGSATALRWKAAGP